MPFDPATVKLGKLEKKQDPRTLRLADYLAALPSQLPKPRRTTSWARKTQHWPMLMNDAIGDCTIASTLHMQQTWRDNIGIHADYVVTDAQALEAYSRICGYDGTDATDFGGVEIDVLNAWRKDGIGGRKIDAFVSVDRQRHNLVKMALDWFGGIYIGIGLPESAQDQVGKVWDKTDGGVSGQPYSWGGHAVNIVGYNDKTLTCVTWGAKQRMTWAFWDYYVDEAYAVISRGDWMNEQGATPRGLNLDQLMSDLKLVTKI